MTHRHTLPQFTDRLFLTDGAIETMMIFHEGLELPDFAAFHLLADPAGEDVLRRYFRGYADIARRFGTGLILGERDLESATWRANPDWGARLGYSRTELAAANRQAVRLLEDIRDEYAQNPMPVEQVDTATSHYPSYYMINCAHPTHFEDAGRSQPGARCPRGAVGIHDPSPATTNPASSPANASPRAWKKSAIAAGKSGATPPRSPPSAVRAVASTAKATRVAVVRCGCTTSRLRWVSPRVRISRVTWRRHEASRRATEHRRLTRDPWQGTSFGTLAIRPPLRRG